MECLLGPENALVALFQPKPPCPAEFLDLPRCAFVAPFRVLRRFACQGIAGQGSACQGSRATEPPVTGNRTTAPSPWAVPPPDRDRAARAAGGRQRAFPRRPVPESVPSSAPRVRHAPAARAGARHFPRAPSPREARGAGSSSRPRSVMANVPGWRRQARIPRPTSRAHGDGDGTERVTNHSLQVLSEKSAFLKRTTDRGGHRPGDCFRSASAYIDLSETPARRGRSSHNRTIPACNAQIPTRRSGAGSSARSASVGFGAAIGS